MKLLNSAPHAIGGLRSKIELGAPFFVTSFDFEDGFDVRLWRVKRPHAALVSGLTLSVTAAWVLLVGFAFQAGAQTTHVIPAAWRYASGVQDTNAPGFNGRIHQARQNAALSATIARGNAQLSGTLTDPQTGQPYANLVVTWTNEYSTNGLWSGFAVNADGSFAETNVVNYSMETGGLTGDLGNFNSFTGHSDSSFPGLPGANDTTFSVFENVGDFAIEEFAFLELKAGTYTFAVNCDDSFEFSLHPNDARDIFRKSITAFGSNRGLTESTGIVQVEADGLYSARLLHAQYQNSPPAQLEFYTLDPSDPTLVSLVNDRTQPDAVKAWRTLTVPSRPYIRSIEPSADATGVQPTASIRAILVNLGTNTPVMKINGATVSPVPATSGNETTLTYTPITPLAGGAVVSVEVQYAGAIGSWSYVTRTGVKALMIVGGTATASDNWMAARLASQFGLDVIVKTDSAVQTNDAAGTVLIVNSATVNSGNVALKNFEELPIPILNGEQANVDDFLMGTAGGNVDLSQVEIVDSTHPIAGGLVVGVHDLYTTSGVNQCHNAGLADTAVLVGVNPANPGQALIFALDEGADFQGFLHPARRVHLGIVGNDGGNRFNAAGIKLFDASVRWLLKLPDQPLRFNPTVLANASVTISWTGTGTLEEALTVNGPWSTAASQANPQTVSATGTKFFRLKQ